MADTTFVNGHYLSRAWRMMTQDKGWLAPVCILALCLYVPIVGALGVAGYALCWARLTAWGIDAAPKQRGVRVGECIAAGWRAFVVALGWGLLAGIVTSALTWLLGDAGSAAGLVLALLMIAIDIFVGLFVFVATLRSCIYQKIGPGFGFSQIWTMYTHDLGGLFHILGIEILGGLIAAIPMIIMGLAMIPSVLSLAWSAYYSYATDTTALILASFAGLIQSAILPMLLAGFVTQVIGVITMLLVYTAGGLWIRQFNVPAWGSPSDPVPPSPDPEPLPAAYGPGSSTDASTGSSASATPDGPAISDGPSRPATDACCRFGATCSFPRAPASRCRETRASATCGRCAGRA